MKNDYENLIDNDKYQVFLFITRGHLPFGFATHPWIVTNRHGVVDRWEVLFQKNKTSSCWGHLYKNFLPPFQGIGILHFMSKYYWTGKLLGAIQGDEHSDAKKMIDFIEQSKDIYPYRHNYRLTGPNSNTYVQWILNHFPEFKVKLPRNAFGKNYKLSDNPDRQ